MPKNSIERPEVCALLRGARVPLRRRVAVFIDRLRYLLRGSWTF